MVIAFYSDNSSSNPVKSCLTRMNINKRRPNFANIVMKLVYKLGFGFKYKLA